MRVYQITADADAKLIQANLDADHDFNYIPCKTEADIIDQCSDAEVLITIYEPVSEKVIQALEDLKYICIPAIGFNYTDVDAARAHDVKVSNNPNYCIEEVADHTLALMLDGLRKITAFNKSTKVDQQWDFNLFGNNLRRISSLTIALVGYGRISRQVRQRLSGFNSKVIAYDPFIDEEAMAKDKVEKVDLDQLAREADVISIHLPLNEGTRHLIDGDFLSKLTKSPVLINCSRGEIIDEDALYQALKAGQLSAAGLDVLSSENPELAKEPLASLDQVTLTPHVAFYSRESIAEVDLSVAKFINAFAKGQLDNIPWVKGS